MKDKFQNLPPLTDAVTLKIANVSKYDDYQIEIRDARTNQLIWRAWDFQPDFDHDFSEQLKQYGKR
jgi:hypothetical protein